MIGEPTRITINSETLLDVMLTNAPETFTKCGTSEPEISDHRMIYAELTEKVQRHKTKTITFRQTKKTDFKELNRDLTGAPWHVGDILILVTARRSMTTGRRYLSQLWINTNP